MFRFSNTGEEMIGMMYLADGGMMTDFDSMRLESHSRVLFHPPKLESSPEPPITPQPKSDKNETIQTKTKLDENVDGRSSSTACCMLYRFRPEDQTTSQHEECSSLQTNVSALPHSSRGENQAGTSIETQTKRKLLNDGNSSTVDTESTIREQGRSGLRKQQERIQVTHFRFSDDLLQLSDQTEKNDHNDMNPDVDDDESYSNVENDLQDEQNGHPIANGGSGSGNNSNSKRVGKKSVVKPFKEKQKPLQRVRRRRGEDDDYDDEHDDEHEQGYEYDRHQSTQTRLNISRTRNLNYPYHHHYHHTKNDGNGNGNGNGNDGMIVRGVGSNSRRRTIPASMF